MQIDHVYIEKLKINGLCAIETIPFLHISNVLHRNSQAVLLYYVEKNVTFANIA